MKSYQQFYHSQIKRAQASSCEGTHAGLITINGPTGLGKTSAITEPSTDGEPSVLNTLKSVKRQGLFITHRWNILQQVAAEVREQGMTATVVYGRKEQVLGAVLGKPFAHEDSHFQPGDWQTCP